MSERGVLVTCGSAVAEAVGVTGLGEPSRWRPMARAHLILLLCVSWPCLEAGAADPPEAVDKERPRALTVSADCFQLHADHEVWVNLKEKYVVVGGQVCLREGVLEMFACPRGTKEHESVVSTNSPARFVHAGLLMIGARSGPAMQYHPVYKPAGGTEIDVEVVWEDAQGTLKRVRAQEWVKYIRTGKALDYPWVFAGSLFLMDEAAQERYYCADGGELICVSNFSTAMLDLPVESGDANDNLMFAAFTENIPPLRTPVNLILTPKRPEKVDGSEKEATKDAPSPDGSVKPDASKATPDASKATPDAGKATPDASKATPDAGKATPDAGKATPDAKGSEVEQSKQSVGTTGK